MTPLNHKNAFNVWLKMYNFVPDRVRTVLYANKGKKKIWVTFRRAQNEPSNPSIFGQMLSFEIFTQSESIGSTTSVVKFSYSNSFYIWENWQFVNYEVNRRTALFCDFIKCRFAVRIDNAWRIELGHSDSPVHHARVTSGFGCMNRMTSRVIMNHPPPSSPCSMMYAWSSHAISRPILIIAELNIHDFKEEELHSKGHVNVFLILHRRA